MFKLVLSFLDLFKAQFCFLQGGLGGQTRCQRGFLSLLYVCKAALWPCRRRRSLHLSLWDSPDLFEPLLFPPAIHEAFLQGSADDGGLRGWSGAPNSFYDPGVTEKWTKNLKRLQFRRMGDAFLLYRQYLPFHPFGGLKWTAGSVLYCGWWTAQTSHSLPRGLH